MYGTALSLPRQISSVSYYVRIARPDHWIKNVLVLPGMASAMAFTKPSEPLWVALVAAVSICLIASANYTINEFLDARFDLHHPLKNNRPGPLGLLDWRLVTLQYVLLAATGIGLATTINGPFLIVSLALLAMGMLYNIPPVRTKDYPYLDVLSESINNPLRFLLGWFAVTAFVLPPSSVLLAYWMGGAYLMGIKRYSEYRRIGDPKRAALYRKSFAVYSENTLLLSAFFYALCAAFFIGVFLLKYKVEFVLTFPLFAALFTWYLGIGLKPDSAAQAPETLYREGNFLGFAAALFVVSIFVFYIDIPLLKTLIDTNLIPIGH
jgi:decaprenyl-phosphate phosphoribosyltransferase